MGVLDPKPQIHGALAVWALGLTYCAAAGFCVAKSQREFQVVAGHNYRRLAKQFFGLELTGKVAGSSNHLDRGLFLREVFWGLCVSSIGAFVIGAFVAVYRLL